MVSCGIWAESSLFRFCRAAYGGVIFPSFPETLWKICSVKWGLTPVIFPVVLSNYCRCRFLCNRVSSWFRGQAKVLAALNSSQSSINVLMFFSSDAKWACSRFFLNLLLMLFNSLSWTQMISIIPVLFVAAAHRITSVVAGKSSISDELHREYKSPV